VSFWKEYFGFELKNLIYIYKESGSKYFGWSNIKVFQSRSQINIQITFLATQKSLFQFRSLVWASAASYRSQLILLTQLSSSMVLVWSSNIKLLLSHDKNEYYTNTKNFIDKEYIENKGVDLNLDLNLGYSKDNKKITYFSLIF
jgi:hypothetical protein